MAKQALRTNLPVRTRRAMEKSGNISMWRHWNAKKNSDELCIQDPQKVVNLEIWLTFAIAFLPKANAIT